MSLGQQRESVAAKVVLRRPVFPGAIMLVEGPSDAEFWTSYARRGVLHCEPCSGRLTLIQEHTTLHKADRLTGVLTVMDADWDHIDQVQYDLPDLFVTDTRDLESMLLRTPALDKVLDNRADAAKLAALEAEEGGEFRELLLARAVEFGRLRLLGHRRPLFEFFERFVRLNVDKEHWRVTTDKLHQELVSQGLAPDVATLRADLDALPPNLDPWSLARGHDLMFLLKVALDDRLRRERPKQASEDALLWELCLALPEGALHTTRLHQSLRAWEARQPQYMFLR
jgi:hypothetical protein